MHTHTIGQLSQLLRSKKISALELTRYFLERIKKYDPTINSYITVTESLALEQAKSADRRLADGDASPLLGIPFAHKDIFCTKGIKTSCGSKMLDNFIAPYDATVTEKLMTAGMVMLGKTNMDEFAMGSSNETSFYGPVKNPWDITCVPGGSSGGAVAAVAAGLATCATGTDTGGSIRQPAAFTGLTGLKPTYGLISRWGMIAFASSLDQAGPIAHNAKDAALLLQAMAGFDAKDSTSVDLPVPDYLREIDQDIRGLKIGLPAEFFNEQLDPAIAEHIETAAKHLENLGATLIKMSLPNVGLAIPTYYVVAPTECASNLSRYDGVRFGYRCSDPKNLEDLYKRSRSEGFGDEVKRRLIIGTHVSSTACFDAYYLKAQKVRHLIRNDFVEAFKKVDIILGPTTPSVAFKLGEKTSDPISMYLSDLYTAATNLAGLPGLSIPCGFLKGLPVGLQLTGADFSEALLLKTAHSYQQTTDHHQQFPKEFA